ncbi:MAG: alpha/beta hydrolase, partial [Pseudomonadota bacterium]
MLRRMLIISLVLLVILAVGWASLRRADIPFDTLESIYTSNTSRFMTLENGLKLHYRDEGQG